MWLAEREKKRRGYRWGLPIKERIRRPPKLPAGSALLMEAIYQELDWRLDRLAHQLGAGAEPFTTPMPVISEEVRAEWEAWKRLREEQAVDEP